MRAGQLHACARMLEMESEDDNDEGVVAPIATALLDHEGDFSPGFARLVWPGSDAWRAVQHALRLRDGVGVAHCSLSDLFGATRTYNHVKVSAEDSEGESIESIETGDVCVCVEGGSVVCMTVSAPGRVEVIFSLPLGYSIPVILSVRVCGSLPCTLRVYDVIGSSEILETVSGATRAAFLRMLTEEWLPGRAYTLLNKSYRTPAAFHASCDHIGRTLVLVRCDKGWVFGGYANSSWHSSSVLCRDPYQPNPDGFVMSVSGPHSPEPVRFPVKPAYSDKALFCDAALGPCFTGGLHIRGENRWTEFNDKSSCHMGKYYEDVLGKGFTLSDGKQALYAHAN
ncbi:MAG: TLD domain-containing protein [Terracidiphilus sp.]|nr:TLD domain-containing protein [Terracidiphilus sp.]